MNYSKDENKMKNSKNNQGYKKLKIYQLAHDLAVRVHRMSMTLPKFETFEEGSQIRRSSKSVSSNIESVRSKHDTILVGKIDK